MNRIVIKTIIGFLSLGAVTGSGILTKNYIKNDGQLISVAKVAQKSSVLKDVDQEIKEAKKELNEAKDDKEKAEERVKNAEEMISKATKEKEEAILELKNAKTTEERQKAQAKIDAATTKIDQAKKTKESAEKEVERAAKVVEQKEQIVEEKVTAKENKQNQAVSNKKTESNSNTTNNKKQSTTKNNTTTKQKEEEQGPKYDLSDYPDILDKINEETKRQEKEIEEEAKKKTVEFHFYSTNKDLLIRCTEDYCGDSGHIWFVELECDPTKCEGFTNSSGNKVSTLLVGRRADITNYTISAPAAKYGYRFVGWELISSRKAVSNELGSGVLSGKYIATYEKV